MPATTPDAPMPSTSDLRIDKPGERSEQRWGRSRNSLLRLKSWLADQIQIEQEQRSSFAFLPIGTMLAIGLIYGCGWRPFVWLAPALLALCWLASRLSEAKPFRRSLLLLPLGFGLGLGAGWVELTTTRTVMLSGNATTRIIGVVTLREQNDRGRYRYTIDVERTERPTLSRPPQRVRVLVSSRHEPLPIGARYSGLVRLSPPAGPAFPGAYDFAFTPFFDGTSAFGYSLGPPKVSEEEEAVPSGLMGQVASLRLAIGERIRAVLPDERGAVAAALINGERAGIPKDIEDALRATGLAHVLSISGFHMALVAGMTMVVVRGAAAAFPAIALRWQTRKIGAVLALGVTGFYFLLAGDNAATERSFIMIAIMLGAVLVDRPALTIRNVGMAAMAVMLISPHALMTATFQMSFAATAALVGAYGAYSRWSNQSDGKASDHARFRTLALLLLGAFLSSLIAGAATAPYAVYHFQRAAPFGLVANVLATPIFSFWIMPLALASVCLMPFGWESMALHPIGWGLDVVFWLAKRLAEELPDYAVGQIGLASLLSLTMALLVLSFCQSAMRWLFVLPLTLGWVLIPPTNRPELLIAEDARDIAVIGQDGSTIDLRKRPNRFIHDQWQRAFQLRLPPSRTPRKQFECSGDICRATSRSGLRIAWSDKLERMGELCDSADIAVMARAPRMTSCRSGAKLVTLRTLRQTGALLLPSANGAQWTLQPSIAQPFNEWNVHRSAPWPESERRNQRSEPGQVGLPHRSSDSAE
ncbi:ComEC/Rec2 family competence protein [Aureimonas sp. D3]|uniref:ComEC/Rec2 family competence protein n=1 Tax=Aureimonas sp. D3 TaxID=1638164 RepID=UPI001AEBC1CB|nr:ComEC/Rec2 family competence protein [Aureimonas sp. D3]